LTEDLQRLRVARRGLMLLPARFSLFRSIVEKEQ